MPAWFLFAPAGPIKARAKSMRPGAGRSRGSLSAVLFLLSVKDHKARSQRWGRGSEVDKCCMFGCSGKEVVS